MASPSLMGIPTECRLKILGLVLADDPPEVELTFIKEVSVTKDIVRPVMLTCHQLRTEALDAQCLQTKLSLRHQAVRDHVDTMDFICRTLRPSWFTPNITVIDIYYGVAQILGIINKDKFPRSQRLTVGVLAADQDMSYSNIYIRKTRDYVDGSSYWDDLYKYFSGRLQDIELPKSEHDDVGLQKLAKESIGNIAEMEIDSRFDGECAREMQEAIKMMLRENRGFRLLLRTVIQAQIENLEFKKWVSLLIQWYTSDADIRVDRF